jgi:hypothetical protein
MPLLRVVHSALGASVLLAACGGNESPGVDAGPCWPLNATPGGQVELGTGDIDFEPMPDMISIISNASQSDPYIQVHSRIRGLPPGDPRNLFDPRNPKTKVSAVIPDLGLVLGMGIDCPATLGYVASPEPGAFDLSPHSLRFGFGFGGAADQASGKQAHITIEVVGSNGLYAQAEKLVTLMMTTSGGAPGASVPVVIEGSP